MKITTGLENATRQGRTITTLGSYDGVHRGHQHILAQLNARKRELGLDRSVLVTFHPHPQEILRRNDTGIELLTTIDERLALIAEQGIDEAVVIEFSLEFAQTSYIDFFQRVLVEQLGTEAMVVGFNHAFGKDRAGSSEQLQKLAPTLGVSIEEVQPVTIDSVSVSSTKIRNALRTGAIKDATAWLGRAYAFTGTVVHGDALGRTLGYPTANIVVPAPKLVPGDGVYSARVSVPGSSKAFAGALSIGTRPTVSDAGVRSIEVLLLGFEGDLYGRPLTVECLEYLRPQERYDSLEALKDAIAGDVSRIARG